MDRIPDPQAYFVLFLFPALVVVLFSRMELRRALIWSVVLGYLFLPSAGSVYFDWPLLPRIDKNLIPSLTAAVAAYFVLLRHQNRSRFNRHGAQSDAAGQHFPVLPGLLPRSPVSLLLLAMSMCGIIITTITNRDPLVYGPTTLPGHTAYDIFSTLLTLAIMLLPLLLGRKFLANNEGHKLILAAFAVSALIYSLPALYEVRMSPQLSMIFYGFFPHDFAQHIRAGGFRPLVFLSHGLHLGIFFACALLAIATLVRLESGSKRALYMLSIPYILIVLFLSKNLGALAIGIALLPVALFLPVRAQMLVAAMVAGITISYPLLRAAQFIPTTELVEIAASMDLDRARSLQFRFDNEEALLEKVAERPLFGWGSWGRWRVYDEAGRDTTVSDGHWIITIGRLGWVGYISIFGLLCLPVIFLTLRQKHYDVGLAISGMSILIMANIIDLLPNSSLSPVLLLAVGSLIGQLELQRDKVMVREQSPSRYTRFAAHHQRRGNTPG